VAESGHDLDWTSGADRYEHGLSCGSIYVSRVQTGCGQWAISPNVHLAPLSLPLR